MNKTALLGVPLMGLFTWGGFRYAEYRYEHHQTNWYILEPTGSDSSPIIITDGSIHVRQWESDIIPTDPYNAYIHLRDHTAVDLKIGRCQPGQVSSSCTYGPAQTISAPWTLQLEDASGKVLSTLVAPSQTGFIVFSTFDYNETLTGEDTDGNNGEGYFESSKPGGPVVNLGQAVLNNSGSMPVTLTCPAAAPGDATSKCAIRIRYCKTGGTNCS